MANSRDIRWRLEVLASILNDENKSNAVEFAVRYDKGGINYFTYQREPAGYWLVVNPVKIEDGSVIFLMGANIGRRFYLTPGDRFNAKKLAQLADAIRPKTAEIVAALARRDYDAMRATIEGAIKGAEPKPKSKPCTAEIPYAKGPCVNNAPGADGACDECRAVLNEDADGIPAALGELDERH